MTPIDNADPRGLIKEAYRIEDITEAQCRSIFFDWALSFEGDTKKAITTLIEYFDDQSHPMTQILIEGSRGISAPRRRGGWRARNRESS